MIKRFTGLILSATLTITAGTAAFAQDMPVGYWRAHLPYNNVYSAVASADGKVYAAAQQSFFGWDRMNGELTTYSKVDGMSDIGMQKIGYDEATGTVVLAYANSNIDLFRNGSFFNIPYIKNESITGSKIINDIFTTNQLAYISADFGAVVIDLEEQEVRSTYTFTKDGQTLAFKGMAVLDGFMYAATSKGLYRIATNAPAPQVFTNWSIVDTARSLAGIVTIDDSRLYYATKDSLFMLTAGSSPEYVPHGGGNIVSLDEGYNELIISVFYGGFGEGKIISSSNTLAGTINSANPREYARLSANTFIMADAWDGLFYFDESGNRTSIVPDGPTSFVSWDIIPYNKEVWIAHGAYSDIFFPRYSGSNISWLKDDKWTRFNLNYFQDTLKDVIDLAMDRATGTLYAGTYFDGVYARSADGKWTVYQQGALDPYPSDKDFGATGITIDANGALWVNQNGSQNELAALTKDGSWHQYNVPGSFVNTYNGAGIITDDANQKWYFVPVGGGTIGGVVVYNDNNTPDNGADDKSRKLSTGKGAGNLPSNTVYSIAADRDGAIWIGTADGIGVVNCPAQVIEGSCEADIPVVQYDQFAGLLFKGEQVRAIAVDGANRKWIGTNNGVWLVSPSGDAVIYRFTAENSPLFANGIQSIAVDPITGDVYIGTDQGLISYRSTATEGGEQHTDVLVFPNPVPSGYSGEIAIRGLVTDADVRITDIAGQLVYRTKAFGGQAVWNGKDYTGKRAASGVYLVFSTNSDGSQSYKGKIIFQE